jgi:hypothetical protein
VIHGQRHTASKPIAGPPDAEVIASPAFAKGSAMMPEPDRDEQPPACGRASSVRKHGPSDEPMDEEEMDEEEKVLAGHPDANMPALLTQDVPGG